MNIPEELRITYEKFQDMTIEEIQEKLTENENNSDNGSSNELWSERK